MSNEIPRRCRYDLYTPAEKAISDAMQEVEKAGCDTLLTDAVMLLSQAKDKVADFVDKVKPKCNHIFDSDGGACRKCGKTVSELLDNVWCAYDNKNSIDWVDCPICGEPDMRQTISSEGDKLIFCTNHACKSNGGTYQKTIK